MSQEMLNRLYATQMFGIKLGLEGITRLLTESGALPCSACVIHVAGTNGKGSVCAMAEAVARCGNIRTGLFTSPHLVRFNERIRINGIMISDEEVERHLSRLFDITANWEHQPTFFEMTLALAMLHFREKNAELIILETGMGGRLDATNAVPKHVAVITPIGLDHAQYLGHTLAEIATEKGGIIQRKTPVVSARQEDEVCRVLNACARAQDTRIRYVMNPAPWECRLCGDHQRMNAALSLAALEAAGYHFPDTVLAEGLRTVQWAGRFEEVFPGVIMDGAHNPHAARVLANTWQKKFPQQKARCVFAASADKDIRGVVDLLKPLVEEWILPPVDSPRISPPEETARILNEAGITAYRTILALADAFEVLQDASRPVLICGSFFLLGQAKALLELQPYRPSAQ